MRNTAKEVMLVPTYKYRIKNISFYSLKYEDHKKEVCSLIYPNLVEKPKANRPGVRVMCHMTPYKCQKLEQVAKWTAQKVLLGKRSIAMFSL